MKENKFKLSESNRRVFLQKSLLLLGATATASLVGVQTMAGESYYDKKKLVAFSLESYRILDAVADTLIPHGGAFELGARDIDLAGRIDKYLALESADVVTGVTGALQYLEQNAPALISSKAKFTSLDFADRTRVLEAMLDGDLLAMQVLQGMKGLCTFYFYTYESVWPSIGYDGPWVKS
jgi:hypothetical protein